MRKPEIRRGESVATSGESARTTQRGRRRTSASHVSDTALLVHMLSEERRSNLGGKDALPMTLSRRPSRQRRVPWIALGVVMVFGAGLGFAAWSFALRRTSAGRMGSITYLSPAIAILLGWALLAERPPWLAVAGGALCLGGVYLARRRPALQRQARAAGAAGGVGDHVLAGRAVRGQTTAAQPLVEAVQPTEPAEEHVDA